MTIAAIKPRVTVLMPVYNASATVADALESILSQTFRDFELLVIDDGSSDSTAQIIKSYGDSRLRYVANDHNLGVVHTLNRGIELAEGDYIARMDADDISLPVRLETQVAFMDSNPEVGVCGTWVETYGDRSGDVWRFPVSPDDIHAHLLFHSVLAHPTVCLRREAFIKNGLYYDEHYPHAEDFQLWQRAAEYFPLANLGEVLLKYKVHSKSIARANPDMQAHTLRRIDREALLRLGIDASDSELNIHRCLAFSGEKLNDISVDEAERWLRRLIEANKNIRRYSQEALQRTCGVLWLRTCQVARNNGRRVTRRFLLSPLARDVALRNRAKFALCSACSVLGLSQPS